jgi:hypothetical protein
VRHSQPPRAGFACALMLVLSAAALGACGGSGSKDATASSDNSREAQERARLQLTACLRKQGVDLPDRPGQGAGGGGAPSQIDRQKVEKAMQGPCKKYQQKAFGNFSAEDRAEMRDRMVKFSACMREHGVDLPDPGSGGGAQTFRFDRDDPKVSKATEACRDKLPQGGRGGPGVTLGPGGPPPGQ